MRHVHTERLGSAALVESIARAGDVAVGFVRVGRVSTDVISAPAFISVVQSRVGIAFGSASVGAEADGHEGVASGDFFKNGLRGVLLVTSEGNPLGGMRAAGSTGCGNGSSNCRGRAAAAPGRWGLCQSDGHYRVSAGGGGESREGEGDKDFHGDGQ